MYARVFVTEATDEIALVAETKGNLPKQWAIDSGCTNHFSPYKSDFVTYKPYDTPGSVHVGDAWSIPSLGEGTVSITCIVGGKSIPCLIHDVQYVDNRYL